MADVICIDNPDSEKLLWGGGGDEGGGMRAVGGGGVHETVFVCMNACFFVYVSVVCIRWRAYGAGASLCVKASVSKRMSVSEGLSVCCLSVSDVCADVKLMSRQA